MVLDKYVYHNRFFSILFFGLTDVKIQDVTFVQWVYHSFLNIADKLQQTEDYCHVLRG